MNLIVAKFIELFSRAIFVVGATYSLDLGSAGRFGLVVTLVGLFAFAANFERHTDILRRHVGQSPKVIDRTMVRALRFWSFNFVAMSPPFLLLVVLLVHPSPRITLMVLVIAVGEQIANAAYQSALIDRRYRILLYLVAAKNVVLMAGAIPFYLRLVDGLSLAGLVEFWLVAQVITTAAMAMTWRYSIVRRPLGLFRRRIWAEVVRQYRESATLFKIGSVAIVFLQGDRLIVGALLSDASTGLYFRHLLAVSFAYQFFSVASYNRFLPSFFLAATRESNRQLLRRSGLEFGRAAAIVCLAFALAWAGDAATGERFSDAYSISFTLAGALLGGAILRMLADLIATIYYARRDEASVLRRQAIACSAGAAALIALTAAFGIAGTAAAMVFGAALYLGLLGAGLARVPQRTPAAPSPAT